MSDPTTPVPASDRSDAGYAHGVSMHDTQTEALQGAPHTPPPADDPAKAPASAPIGPAAWTPAAARRLYGIDAWGGGYFTIDDTGRVVVRRGEDDTIEGVSLIDIVEGLRERGLHAPVLLRFTDVLEGRMAELRNAFDQAIADNEYGGGYTCVYPVKVNQQKTVCEDVRDAGAKLGFGLEAGSKPELLAVLGLTVGHPEMPIVCNGFKDAEYIETVVLAAKLGRTITPVVEQPEELGLIVDTARRYGVRPRIGVRVKPNAAGAGRWSASAGMRSKFGLHTTELIHAMELLKDAGMEDCLRLVHFHIGSQICEIGQLKNAVSELTQVYCELRRLGATGLDHIDVGGGLGVDYDGSQSAWSSSVNYSLAEYAGDVVYRIKSVCDNAGQPHPTIVSESGRAMTAHASVLVTEVIGKTHFARDPDLAWIEKTLAQEEADYGTPQPLIALLDTYRDLDREDADPAEAVHDSQQACDEAAALFRLGYLSLPQKAAAERLHWAVGRRVAQMVDAEEDPDARRAMLDRVGPVHEAFSDIYFCNFSVFQSMPDSWAIDQLFPICPLHRLDERPERRAILADVTCDSDGQVSLFSSPEGGAGAHTLSLHKLSPGDESVEGRYYLGIFLVGAYQEVLGDLHNLFGDTHAAHVRISDDGKWTIDEIVEGDTVREVLSYVQFEPDELRRAMRRDTERAVQAGAMSPAESRSLLNFYDHGLSGYTYLEGPDA